MNNIILRLAGGLSPQLLFNNYSRLARKQGLKRAYFILSFDCDTEFDIEVIEELAKRLGKIGINPVYAVPGNLLEKGARIFRNIADTRGSEFINHGYRVHTVFDSENKLYRSVLFYNDMPSEEIIDDIKNGHNAVSSIIGRTPSGFRVPHFGTFQKQGQLNFVYDVIKELGYKYSTSTLPSFAFLKGPVKKTRNGLYEIAVSGCYDRPLHILDSWGFRFAPRRVFKEADYKKQFEKMANYIKDGAAVGILNCYVDPSQVYNWDLFFECMKLAAPFAISSYSDLLKEAGK